MAIASSIDVTLKSKTEKFDKGMKHAENRITSFASRVGSISAKIGNLFNITNIARAAVSLEGIKKIVNAIGSRMKDGLFPSDAQAGLERVSKAWGEMSDRFFTLIAAVVSDLAPGIESAFQIAIDMMDSVIEAWEGLQDSIRRSAGAPKIAEVSDKFSAEDRRKASAFVQSERAKAAAEKSDAMKRADELSKQFEPLSTKLQKELREVTDLFSRNLIREDTFLAAKEDINKQWSEFIDEGKKATEEYNQAQIELVKKHREEELKLRTAAWETEKKRREKEAEDRLTLFETTVMDPLRKRADDLTKIAESSLAPSAIEAGSGDFAAKFLEIQKEQEQRIVLKQQLQWLQTIAANTAKAHGIPIAVAAL